MTIKELIEKLQEFDPTMRVGTYNQDWKSDKIYDDPMFEVEKDEEHPNNKILIF